MIQLIIGLGNPGKEHENDRHNAGFWLCDQFADSLHMNFSLDSKFKGHLAHGKYKNHDIWCLKPTTYMNLSGEAVGAICRFHQIPSTNILVIHDELDLAPGTVRLKWAGGTGGHNGLKSIQQHLGTLDFWRIRLGIGHPRQLVEPGQPHQEVASYVLKRPPKLDLDRINQSIEKTRLVFSELLSNDPASAMKTLHQTSV